MSAKTILCFGDSNTWGMDGLTGERYAKAQRWPGALARELGDGFEIIEEGLVGRTTVWDDPLEGYRSGKSYLVPCLDSHAPLDLVVLMLGTNDFKARLSLSPMEVALGVQQLLLCIQQSKAGRGQRAPAVLLVAPPAVTPLSNLAEMFKGAEEKSQALPGLLRNLTAEHQVLFFNAQHAIQGPLPDGVHLKSEHHAALAKSLAPLIQKHFYS